MSTDGLMSRAIEHHFEEAFVLATGPSPESAERWHQLWQRSPHGVGLHGYGQEDG